MDLKAKEIECLAEMLAECEYLLIGLGDEWEKAGQDEVRKAYESLYNLVGQKDYFIVTTATDARIFDAPFDEKRITAPCGNINWF